MATAVYAGDSRAGQDWSAPIANWAIHRRPLTLSLFICLSLSLSLSLSRSISLAFPLSLSLSFSHAYTRIHTHTHTQAGWGKTGWRRSLDGVDRKLGDPLRVVEMRGEMGATNWTAG
jgi:hypothetical protein